jgi:O-antigen/teichoic acid export membrane protein
MEMSATDRFLPYAIATAMVLAYVLPSLLATRALDKYKFREYFKKLFITIILLSLLFMVLPNGPKQYYYEAVFFFIIILGGGILHISARRYLDIGDSRWNTFLPFVHFSEFLRLWLEEPPASDPKL